MREKLRIFISSPGDVSEERLRAHLVIQKLARDYARFYAIEAYLWEHEPMLASGHFQDAIEPPSTSDVVVLILFSRLGTPLPERTNVREYRGIDGRTPVTGTEWEYEEALAASRAKGAPDLLAYRRLGDPGASLADPERRAEQERQWAALEAFWRRHFEDSGVFLAGSAKFESLEEFDRKLENDLTALIERRIAAGKKSGNALVDSAWFRGNPYLGLLPYDFEHSEIFFGRDAQIRSAVTRLQTAAERGCGFLFVTGGSGSGKSSLARAGIVPALVAPKAVPGIGVWRRVVTKPGNIDPILNLATALLEGSHATGIGLPELAGAGMSATDLAEHLRASANDPSFPFRTALDRVAEKSRATGLMLAHEQPRLLILIDQLEEMFSASISDETRTLFARILSGLARSGLVWIVATMRSDLWHKAAEARLLVELIEAGARLDLQAPSGAEILEIVRRPAMAAGLSFEADLESGTGLDAVLAHEAAEDPSALPLLSVMLHSLYVRDILDAPSGADTLTFTSYRDLGELKGAIAKRAEETLAALAKTDPEAAASLPVVLRSLATVSPDRATVTARTARLAEFAEGGPEARLIAAFAGPDARLFVVSEGAGGAGVRVAHEALLNHWPRAAEQIASDRRDLETRARLDALHHRWQEAKTPADKKEALLTGLNLAEGRDLVARWKLGGTALGAYVALSRNAATVRRRWLTAAAAALVITFGVLAAVAGLQWRLAESQRVHAEEQRLLAESERARADAERENALTSADLAEVQRQRAVEEAARAEEERGRALVAMTEARRAAARALASQAQVALEQDDVEGALVAAVDAALQETDSLGPVAESLPALLQTTGAVRQDLHVERASQPLPMRYAFIGGKALAYTDNEAGLVVTDLEPEAHVRFRVPVPGSVHPTHLVPMDAQNRIVVGGGKTITIFDAASGAQMRTVVLPEMVTALGAHERSGQIAVGMGPNILVFTADDQAQPTPIPVPAPRPGTAVGQVRFAASGTVLFVTYGVDVLRFDLATRSFAEAPVAQLSAASVGGDTALLESVLAMGLLTVTELSPDLRNDNSVLMVGPMELLQLDLTSGQSTVFPSMDPSLLVAGLSFTDQSASSSPPEPMVVQTAQRNRRQEFRLSYLYEDGKLLQYQAFAVNAAELAGEKPSSCQVSRDASHLACHYWGDEREGLVTYRIWGGSHSFEREENKLFATTILADGDNNLILTKNGEVLLESGGEESAVATLGEGWLLNGASGGYVSGIKPETGETRIWRLDAATRSMTEVISAIAAYLPLFDANSGRALLATAETGTLYDLQTGAELWSAPAPEGMLGTALIQGTSLAALIGNREARLFAMEDGRQVAAYPLGDAEVSIAAFDKDGRNLAYMSGDNMAIIDLTTGTIRTLEGVGFDVATLSFAPDLSTILIGRRNGSISARAMDGAELWTIASPLGDTFTEDNAWPDMPPKGTVLQIAFSPEGKRFAVIRQDLPTLDLYEGGTGRFLTALTPPWPYGVPASVELPDETRVLSTWAYHAMTRFAPAYVASHTIPGTLPEALELARDRLAALQAVWTPMATEL